MSTWWKAQGKDSKHHKPIPTWFIATSACAWHGNRKKCGKVIFLSIWLCHLIVLISLWSRHYLTGEETEARDSEMTKVTEIRNGAGLYLNSGPIISSITFPKNGIIIPCVLMGLLWKVKVLHKLFTNKHCFIVYYYQTIGTFLSITSYRYQLVISMHFKYNLSITLWQK